MQRLSGSAFLITILGGLVYLSALDVSAQPQHDAIEVGLSCERDPDSIALTMTFRNSDSTDTALFIGSILGNGRKYLASELAVEVEGTNGRRRYRYSDPSVPGIAGRADSWVVELPANSSFSVKRPWSHFWANSEPLSLTRGPFEVRARLDAREIPKGFPIPQFRAFVGELFSEWISVPNDCRSAA